MQKSFNSYVKYSTLKAEINGNGYIIIHEQILYQIY